MKQKSKTKPYIKQFYKGNGWNFALVIVNIVLGVVSNLLISWLLQQILDLVSGEGAILTLSQLAITSLLAMLLIILSSVCAYFSKPKFVQRAMSQYKNYAFEQLSQKGISAFCGENTSLYISALSNDASVIENDYVGSLFEIVQQLLLFVSALTMMIIYNPLLTAVSVGLSLLPIIVSVLTGNCMARVEKQVSNANVDYTSTLKDSLVGFSVVKSFRAEVQMCKMFAKQVKNVSNAKQKSQKLLIIIATCSSIAGVVVQLGVFLVGAYLALNGELVTVGTVLIFVQLLNYVLNPIATVPTYIAKRKSAKGLIQKLADALSENVRTKTETSTITVQNGISVRNLCFGYEQDNDVLHNVNVNFERGKKYAIVGASGSGKSTLLNLLMAGYDGYRGEICYDDVELKNIGTQSLYQVVSIIQQNVFVFNASIRDNVTMFQQFDEEDVKNAINLSGLSKLIAERGENYLCGENGSGLSGGEKQRVSIARSLLKNAKVLLVDEATAALDAETAYQVSSAILALSDVTSIVVTHSLDENLLKQYDEIITLKNGTVVEHGAFDDLIAQKGYFYSLFTVSQ